jgi:hypothetical protein
LASQGEALTDYDKRLENLLRHISHVRQNCELLGQRLIEKGDSSMGLKLISNGQIHDNSKFFGIEWEYLNDGAWPYEDDGRKEMFAVALKQHVSTNPHHPEYWNGIKQMPPVYLAEMVCDWHARSSEQGSDLCEWVKDKATKRFRFTTRSNTYRHLKEFLDLLLEPRFQ